ncbi:MAG TPA: Omp28 family outer membrane lipoprotein [Bacteroidales bacterium]|nr:Omp28 family outer membrane lipoprotein [Bacteroidales bacterium]
MKFVKIIASKKKILLLAMVYAFLSCDKIEGPYKEIHNSGNDTNVYVQKVLIEDFTGHRCGNCPRAHEKLHQILSLYGNKVIGVALHSGFFAMPLPPNYPADFRTTEADEIANTFGVTQWPIGMVNRTEYNGNMLLSHDAWTEAVEVLLQQQPRAYISINSTYSSANSNVDASISVKILQNISEQVKMSVFLTEDSIISAQTDYDQNPTLIPNYLHMHVFRASFNGTWGTEVPISTKQVGDTILRNFNLTWNNAWIKKNCHIVAFIYDVATNHIIQVEQADIQ